MNANQSDNLNFDTDASIYIIAAISKDLVIGYQQTLPWHIPEDLAWFKKSTLGKTLIMGHQTHLSIGRPLPERTNIVLSSRKDLELDGCIVAHSWQQAFKLAPDQEIAVIGGSSLYAQALKQASYLYLTHVEGEFQGDCFFPPIDWSQWQRISQTPTQVSRTGIKFSHAIYHTRK